MAIIPNTNVRLAENIRDVLNSAGGSVTNDVITFFQDRAKINIWAKYKPFRHSKIFNITEGDRASRYYGFSTPPFRTNALDAIEEDFVYQSPRGGSNEPYRLEDFKGYNSAAWQPIQNTNLQGDISWDFDQEDYYTIELLQNWQSDMMNFKNIHPSLKDMYMAFGVISGNGIDYQFKTSTDPFSTRDDMYISLSKDESIFAADELKCFVCACTVMKERFEDPVDEGLTAFLPLPDLRDIIGGSTFYLSIYNWQQQMPIVVLNNVYVDDTEYSYVEPPQYIELQSISMLHIGFMFTFYNDNSTDYHVDGMDITVEMAGQKSEGNLWFQGNEFESFDIPSGGSYQFRMEFNDTIDIPDDYDYHSFLINLNYKNVNMVNKYLRVYKI